MSETTTENTNTETIGDGAAAPKKSKLKLIIIVAAVLLLIGGAGGYFFILRTPAEAKTTEAAEKETKKSSSKKARKEEEKEEESETEEKSDKEKSSDSASASLKTALSDDEAVKNVVELQPFIVNLADESEARYLRMTVSVGISGEGESEKPNPIFITRVRNAMLAVLSVKTSEEVLSVKGKAKLRKELLNAAQRASEEPAVEAIYITDFIVQL